MPKREREKKGLLVINGKINVEHRKRKQVDAYE